MRTENSALTIGDLATLQKVDALGYDYVDGWLRPRRSWRRWLLTKLTALLSDGSLSNGRNKDV